MINLRRGLWRLWIAGSGLWIMIVLLLAAFVFAGPVAHKDFISNCPDLKPEITNTLPLQKWSDQELMSFIAAGNAAARTCIVRQASIVTGLAVVPPTIALLLGLLVGWIALGFRAS